MVFHILKDPLADPAQPLHATTGDSFREESAQKQEAILWVCSEGHPFHRGLGLKAVSRPVYNKCCTQIYKKL